MNRISGNSRRDARVRGLVVVALLALSCDGDRVEGPRSDANQQPLAQAALEGERAVEPAAPSPAAEFRAICDSLQASAETYYGRQRLQRLSDWYADVSAGERSDEDPRRRIEKQLKLAAELIEAGRDAEALEVLGHEWQLEAPLADDPELVEAGGATSAALSPATPGRGDSYDASPGVRRLALQRNAHLQAGEDQNCVLRHSAASCILPFREEALHVVPEHARAAGDLSLAILELRPTSVSARWLLNLSRMLSGDYPGGVPEALRLPAGAFRSEQDLPRWLDRAPALGVNALDLAGGAVMDDFDGDGLLDLVSSTADPCDGLKAFRNDGRGGFQDVSEAWGLRSQLGGLNLVHADYDGDGYLDLLVLRGGWLHEYGRIRNSLLRNRLGEAGVGGGRFVDVTRAAGVARPAAPTQTAAFADYDGDGDLDLYVGNEASSDLPVLSQLFRNRGDGTFADVTEEAGVANLGFAKGVAWGDFDDDGDPDLYVSNIGRNRLYRNEGDGHFRDVAAEAGVVEPEGRSFATWFFDFDNDGDLDLFVADYGAFGDEVMASYLELPGRDAGHPLVYENRGGRFEEVSARLGLRRPQLPMGANYGDFDGDGWLDVYLGTGNPRFEVLIPNLALRNVAGRGFADVSFATGLAHLQKGHGVAFGDLDNDGDEDLFHQLGGFFPGDRYGNALFENPTSGSSWVTLRLVGRRANRFGIGARLVLRVRGEGGSRELHRVAGSGGSFGGSSLQQEIGLGDARVIEELVIRWPGSGTRQQLRDLAPNRIYRVVEGEAQATPVALPRIDLGAAAAHRQRG